MCSGAEYNSRLKSKLPRGDFGNAFQIAQDRTGTLFDLKWVQTAIFFQHEIHFCSIPVSEVIQMRTYTAICKVAQQLPIDPGFQHCS